MKQQIPLAKPYFGDEEVEAVREVLNSGWVAQGPNVNEFEKEFAAYCGAKHGIAVNSCTSGLHMALLAHGIGAGDAVIIPDFTYAATGNVVLHVGAVPRIVDVDLETFRINVDALEECIDETVKAIIPVHPFGYPLDMEKIGKIAKRHGLKIIEDAALGVGSMIDSKKTGSFGNIACFSLQGRKVITTGEGGMIVADNDSEMEELQALRSQGAYANPQKDPQGLSLPLFKKMGFSYRLSDIQAGIGRVQLNKIEKFIDRRIFLAKIYQDRFEDAHIDIETPRPPENIRFNYQTYAVTVKKNRDKLIIKLKEHGIETTIGTYSLSTQPLFKQSKNNCPNGEYVYRHTLALPMFYELTIEQIDYIVKTLKQCFVE